MRRILNRENLAEDDEMALRNEVEILSQVTIVPSKLLD